MVEQVLPSHRRRGWFLPLRRPPPIGDPVQRSLRRVP
jgi:hypothetical protein